MGSISSGLFLTQLTINEHTSKQGPESTKAPKAASRAFRIGIKSIENEKDLDELEVFMSEIIIL